MRKINVIIKRPGEKPHSTWIIDTIENLQKNVEGYIKTFATYIETVIIGTGADPCYETLVIICNEEGRIKGLPYNCTVGRINFVGTIIVAGIKDDEFADIPCTFGTFKRLFPQLFDIEENSVSGNGNK